MPVVMPNPKLFKPHQPKSIDHHALFGVKNLKIHGFRDIKWPATSLTDEYKVMSNCLNRNLQYKIHQQESNRSKQMQNLKLYRNECRDGRLKLKSIAQGDVQLIRNILYKHKDLQRLYQTMPSHIMVDNINQRTFSKRKEGDRLKNRLNNLIVVYKEALIEESKLEDRIKYENEFVLQSEIRAKKCHQVLVTGETRIRGEKFILNAYKNILNVLQQDKRFYEPILDSLVQDIDEQTNFINQIVLMGIPAESNYKMLSNEYMRMVTNVHKNLKDNLQFISQSKKEVTKQQIKVTKIVRESCLTDGPKHNYVRETDSMTALIKRSENIELDMENMKRVTLFPKVNGILKHMQALTNQTKQFRRQLRLENTIYKLTINNKTRSDAKFVTYIDCETDEDVQMKAEINSMRNKIQLNKETQIKCEKDICARGIISNQLHINLRNIIDILRHVNTPQFDKKFLKRLYPNEMLPLPLLQFDAKPIRSFPPRLTEHETGELMIEAQERLRRLMGTKILADEHTWFAIDTAIDEYTDLYMRSIEDEFEASRVHQPDQKENLVVEKIDPNVKTREAVKAESYKIVEDFYKRKEELGV